jgi:hypothetical protein
MANVLSFEGSIVDASQVQFIRPVHNQPGCQVCFVGGGSLSSKLSVADAGKALDFTPPPPAPAK